MPWKTYNGVTTRTYVTHTDRKHWLCRPNNAVFWDPNYDESGAVVGGCWKAWDCGYVLAFSSDSRHGAINSAILRNRRDGVTRY
jgi:hypothetical protein